MTQWAPSRARRSAMPRPMPRPPPVTTATRPSSGLGDAAGAEPEAVGRNALPAEVPRVGGAPGESGNDLAPGHEGLRHAPERLDERRVHGGARAFLAAGGFDLDP